MTGAYRGSIEECIFEGRIALQELVSQEWRILDVFEEEDVDGMRWEVRKSNGRHQAIGRVEVREMVV